MAIATYFINYVSETRANTSNALAAQFLAIAQGCFAIGRFTGSGKSPHSVLSELDLTYLARHHEIRQTEDHLPDLPHRGVSLLCCEYWHTGQYRPRNVDNYPVLRKHLFPHDSCTRYSWTRKTHKGEVYASSRVHPSAHPRKFTREDPGGLWQVLLVVHVVSPTFLDFETLSQMFTLSKVPPILARAADNHNSTAFGMIVPTMFFVSALTYPLCVNFVPAYRIPADLTGDGLVGVAKEGSADAESGSVKSDEKAKA